MCWQCGQGSAGNRLESPLPVGSPGQVLCYFRECVVENTGRVEEARQAPSYWQRRGAVATLCVLLRKCVGASRCGTTEVGSQALTCLSNDHSGLQVVSMHARTCVCVCVCVLGAGLAWGGGRRMCIYIMWVREHRAGGKDA